MSELEDKMKNTLKIETFLSRASLGIANELIGYKRNYIS